MKHTQELTVVKKGNWCEGGFEGLGWSQARSLRGDDGMRGSLGKAAAQRLEALSLE